MKRIDMMGCILGLLIAVSLVALPGGTARSEEPRPPDSFTAGSVRAHSLRVKDPTQVRAGYAAVGYFLFLTILVVKRWTGLSVAASLAGLVAALAGGFSFGLLFTVPTVIVLASSVARLKATPRSP
ncbi:MAG: hypothetical protein ACYC5Y_08625 [Symbiobacteriia bacterium]